MRLKKFIQNRRECEKKFLGNEKSLNNCEFKSQIIITVKSSSYVSAICLLKQIITTSIDIKTKQIENKSRL
jgi:hypothetical protein